MYKKWICGVLTVCIVLLVCMTPVLAVSRSQVLMLGDEDEWVRELQDALHDQGYLKQSPTGYFGVNTQAATMAFQKDNGLAVDGKAGPLTREALLGDKFKEISEDRMADDPIESMAVRPGDRGDEVTEIQSKLLELGYYDYDKITGYYGPITTESVKKFQRAMDITVDGITGENTKTLLFQEKPNSYVLYVGDQGNEVVALQDRLKTLGYFSSKSTGYFGQITLAAVQSFQSNNGLTVDGKAGINTRTKLFSDSAKKASQNKNESNDKAEAPVSKADKLIQAAKDKLGCKYVYGAEGPNSFDCSGLVYHCLNKIGVSISRMSSASYYKVSSWDKIDDVDDLEKGDLVFFRSDSSSQISHVAIYMGNNQIIHALPSAGEVAIDTMTGYWSRNFMGGRRAL